MGTVCMMAEAMPVPNSGILLPQGLEGASYCLNQSLKGMTVPRHETNGAAAQVMQGLKHLPSPRPGRKQQQLRQ